MTEPPLSINITVTRSTDWRSWIATIPGDGRAVGLGPSPDIAVRELFHWSPRLIDDTPKEDPCPAPS